MKQFRMIAATAMLVIGASAHANLIVNGDFESIVAPPASGFVVKNAGSTDITGWTIGGTSVDVIKAPSFGAVDNFSIDLAGTPGPGILSQDFAATAGLTYLLSWDLSKNGAGTALDVGFFGSIFTFAQGTVGPQTLSFVAPTTQTYTLSFTSGGGNFGPVIDNVELITVPAPLPVGLLLAALGLLALRRRTLAD